MLNDSLQNIKNKQVSGLKRKARLYDYATILHSGKVITGKITLISQKGINIQVDKNKQFYKWNNVLNISETK